MLPERDRAGLRPHATASRPASTTRSRSRSTGESRSGRPRPRACSQGAAGEAEPALRERRLGRDERRRRPARERDVEGAWAAARPFFYALVREFVAWKNTEVTVGFDGRRAARADARRDRRERALARRRDEARPRREPRRRALRRRPDRRHQQARLRHHLAEALQGRPRAPSRASRCCAAPRSPSRRPCRCRSSSTASSAGRPRCASRSIPAALACASPAPRPAR